MTKAALDYEAKTSYEVTVTATTQDGLSDSIDVTITVTVNVDEGFEVTGNAALDYAENGTAAVATYSATEPEQCDYHLGPWRVTTLPTSRSAPVECSPSGARPTTRMRRITTPTTPTR